MASAGHTARGGQPAGAWRDRLAAGLMALAAVGALAAALGSAGSAQDTGAGTRIVEAWRGDGLVLFAAMFVLTRGWAAWRR